MHFTFLLLFTFSYEEVDGMPYLLSLLFSHLNSLILLHDGCCGKNSQTMFNKNALQFTFSTYKGFWTLPCMFQFPYFNRCAAVSKKERKKNSLRIPIQNTFNLDQAANSGLSVPRWQLYRFFIMVQVTDERKWCTVVGLLQPNILRGYSNSNINVWIKTT